ncbi:MAG: hypothetical protein KKC80_04425 [Candidatus Margulisbacteria bacterium]|nr:hypothetical protein [Candidatus Margulisiibacteriota bacterium]MBU1617460.1 hypothetical protein [Candidatus Margulisiibacteriota bacterium]
MKVSLIKQSLIMIGQAIKLGEITRFNRCLTGLFGNGQLFRHLALATENGFAHLQKEDQKNKLSKDIANGKLSPDSFFDKALTFRIYEATGKSPTFGVCLATAKEVAIYREGEIKILDNAPGIHREIYFAMCGITARGVRDLPPELYCKLIAKIYCIQQHQELDSVEVINDERGLLRVAYNARENSSRHLTVTISELRAYPKISWPTFTR